MHFVKMEGCGNDYIYVDQEKEQIVNPQTLARKISDRHFGVGADGMILICPSDTADCRMEMYNADGSRGKMCGNGVRCVAKYLYDYKKIRKEEIAVETDSGIHTVRILEDSGKATVAMGTPVIEEEPHVISMEGQKTEMMIPRPVGKSAYGREEVRRPFPAESEPVPRQRRPSGAEEQNRK